jgi:hypothetical protein
LRARRWGSRAQQLFDRRHRRIQRAGLVNQTGEVFELSGGQFRTFAAGGLLFVQPVERSFVGAHPLACRDRHRLRVGHDPLRSGQVPSVGACLDFATDPHPVLLEGVVPLDDGLQSESLSGIADLFPSQPPDAPFHVLLCYLRLDLLDPEKVLLVKRA